MEDGLDLKLLILMKNAETDLIVDVFELGAQMISSG